MNKEKLIFFGAIGVIILIMVIYGVSVYSKKDTSSGSVSADFTVPDLVEKDLAKEDYNNRLKKANSYQEHEKKEDLSKKVEFKTYQSEPKKDIKKEAITEKIKARPGNQNKEVSRKGEELMAVTKNEVTEQKNEDSGGFGIVVSERTNSKKNVSSTQVNGGFFSAVLEEDTKIRNQSSVVFFLLEDCNIDGSIYKKNSILYGKATESGNVFDINIYQIMGIDGKIYSVNGLLVYDEKYSRGLSYEGNINESVKEGMNQSTSEASSALSSSITNKGVDIAAKAVDNTIKAITRKREASINLYKGYKVFIKKQ